MENQDVFLRTSTDGGDTFGSIKNLSNDFADSHIFVLGPQIISTENKIFTVFERSDVILSDLYLKVMNDAQVEDTGTLFMETTNGKVNIILEFGQDSLDLQTLSNFTLTFLEPQTSEPLENLNYTFIVEDVDGNKIVNKQNQQAVNGVDIQNVQFSKEGPMTIIIEVEGTGEDSKFSTFYSGGTSAVITVVPEFPVLFALMVPVMSAVIILSRLKDFYYNRSQFVKSDRVVVVEG